MKTGEGGLPVKVPQIRGRAEPYRSRLWNHGGPTSEVRKKLIVEMDVGGMAQRDIEQGVEKAGGHVLLSQSTVSEMAESLAEEYAAFRTRDLRQEPVADLLTPCMNPCGGGAREPAGFVCGRFGKTAVKCS